MVLICGVPGESPVELIADELEEMGQPFIIFSPRKMEALSFYYEIVNGKTEGEICYGNKSALLSEITGIYNRMIDFSLTPEYRHLSINSILYQKLRSCFDALNNWIQIADCNVLNYAEPMKSNGSKLYQMLLIKEAGFAVPDSIITNKMSALQKYNDEKGKLIYKSASGVRSIVASFKWDDKVALIKNCPTLFQQQLNGINYRVHVVGQKVFATKISSSAVDYRYASRENSQTKLESVTLPLEIEKKCINLSQLLHLPLAGIDLMNTTDNKWYCFEVNPSPGFSYYENGTGQPIAKAIASYLSSKSKY